MSLEGQSSAVGKENKNKTEYSQEKEGEHKFPSERVSHCLEVF